MNRPPSKHEKEAYVEAVFSSIVPKYDFLNALMSLGRHAAWRRLAVSRMGLCPGAAALDVCCGTGDLAFEMAGAVGATGRVMGLDFSVPMIEEAARKAAERAAGVEFCVGKADQLPFEDEVFDGAGVAFGLRNVPDVSGALREVARVVRPGGRVVSLEILDISSGLSGVLWRLYFHGIAPRVTRILGGDAEAYSYLSRSVAAFMSADELAVEFERCGLRNVKRFPLALGGVYIHVGIK